jgi:hypothetical protein
MSQNKKPTPPVLYKDTDTIKTTKVPMPTSIDLYNKIHHDDFPKLNPHSDSEVRVMDDHVFQNIKLSSLYMVASITLILPYVEMLEWIINHTKSDKFLINNVNDQFVCVFLPIMVNKYYKLKEPKVRRNIDFMVKFNEHHNTNQLLASC